MRPSGNRVRQTKQAIDEFRRHVARGDPLRKTEVQHMLVLSRKNQESVVIGGTDGFPRLLKVTVLGINGGKVKLGFDIDASVPVHRGEVWERICASVPVNSPPVSTAAIS